MGKMLANGNSFFIMFKKFLVYDGIDILFLKAHGFELNYYPVVEGQLLSKYSEIKSVMKSNWQL